MITTVKNWLNNPARLYGDGVVLFEAIASEAYKRRYLDYFRKNKDADMLVAKLKALFPSIPITARFEKPILKTPPVPSPQIKINPDEMGETGLRIHARIKEIRPLQASIHAAIALEANDLKRKDQVTELLALESERKGLWAQLDADGNVIVREEIAENPIERGARLQKRMKQLRQNIARGKCTPKKQSEYERELTEIMKELNIT